MSKTYIVSRNGGTVSKAPVNDNKLPIYANETALDADLSNLPDGTICATSSGHDDVIDQMKDYIRKQNVLSDWEDIKSEIGTTSSTAYEVPFDGEILHWDIDSYAESIYVNGVALAKQTNVSGTSMFATFPVTKGDTIYITGLRTDSEVKARYYKNRDYTGR